MAINQVRVDEQQAIASKNRLVQTDLERAKSLMKELQTIVNETRDWWEGQTTESFINSFASGVQVFNTQLNKLETHATSMVDSVRKQNEHDLALAKAVKKF